MCEPMTILAVTAGTAAVAGGTLGAVGAIQQGNYEAAVARNNARMARWKASDAIRRGGLEVGAISTEASKQKGTALAQAATSGVETTSGSMANMFAAGEMAAETDIATAKYNAALEAWGYRTEEQNMLAAAKAAKRQSILGAVSAGLGGFGGAAGALSSVNWGGGGSSMASMPKPSGGYWPSIRVPTGR